METCALTKTLIKTCIATKFQVKLASLGPGWTSPIAKGQVKLVFPLPQDPNWTCTATKFQVKLASLGPGWTSAPS